MGIGVSMEESQFPALNNTGSNFDESSNGPIDIVALPNIDAYH